MTRILVISNNGLDTNDGFYSSSEILIKKMIFPNIDRLVTWIMGAGPWTATRWWAIVIWTGGGDPRVCLMLSVFTSIYRETRKWLGPHRVECCDTPITAFETSESHLTYSSCYWSVITRARGIRTCSRSPLTRHECQNADKSRMPCPILSLFFFVFKLSVRSTRTNELACTYWSIVLI